MAAEFMRTMLTPEVLAAEDHYYGRHFAPPPAPSLAGDTLGEEELAFIAARDSFYLASVSSADWPYVQHRGGAAGLLRHLGEDQLVFADFGGNRQLLSTGNLAGNNRVCLFLMDYPRRVRLKLLGRVEVLDARQHPELAAELASTAPRGTKIERIFRIQVVGFDWNCPQHITPRFTFAELEEAIAPVRARLASLEAELAEARAALAKNASKI
jgi:uncharacterized protein